MGIYILFIFIVPIAITGIAYQADVYSSVKPQSQTDCYIATFLAAVLLFFAPLLWVDGSVYGPWLFWVGIALSVGYFVVCSHREELRANRASRLIGAFAILILLIGSFVAIYSGKEVYDDSVTNEIIKSVVLKPVKDNLHADTTLSSIIMWVMSSVVIKICLNLT